MCYLLNQPAMQKQCQFCAGVFILSVSSLHLVTIQHMYKHIDISFMDSFYFLLCLYLFSLLFVFFYSS